MPATRPHVERDAKVAEILDAAEERLLRDGYEATTMAATPPDAGVSSNAVYWYYPGKDELLAAVMRRRQDRGFARLDERTPAPLPERALAALAALDEVAKVSATVHERARHSHAVAEVHFEFHAGIERRTREAFEAAGLDPEQARLAAGSVIAMVEGIHLHDENRDPASRNELVLWAIERFLGGVPER
jgi:TetR/AcrR family transcriptional regulator, regulator of autoinduction and epiphytic fitness